MRLRQAQKIVNIVAEGKPTGMPGQVYTKTVVRQGTLNRAVRRLMYQRRPSLFASRFTRRLARAGFKGRMTTEAAMHLQKSWGYWSQASESTA